MKKILVFLLFTGMTFSLFAKEGMWLPYLLQKLNADEMHAMGMRITADEIYSMEHSSLKDAIVHFGGGCTAELVSAQGLLLTNHHCGYRSIQKHSTVEQDLLTDGFWAKAMSDELPNPGLTAKIMTSMTDVSDIVLQGVKPNMSEAQRMEIINKHIAELMEKHGNSKFHEVQVKAFYYGNQYIMMSYDVFYDVRLVGAPPSNIGKFGGDTDNWMWPRHTGDFSVFRIYANGDNQPAEYSPENKPYEPRRHLKISLGGVKEGDFTFVFGYPGTTQEYLPSYALEMITQKINPYRIDIRGQKLKVMKEAMDKSTRVRIQYSAKYAGTANGWKKWIGEDKGVEKVNAITKKQEEEQEYLQWKNISEDQQQNILNEFKELYKSMTDWQMAYYYFVETAYYHDLTRYVYGFQNLLTLSQLEEPDTAKINAEAKHLLAGIDGFFKDYNTQVDKKLFMVSLRSAAQFPYHAPQPTIFSFIDKKYKGNVIEYAEDVYEKSLFNKPERLADLLASYSSEDYKKILNDPMYKYVSSVYSNFYDSILPVVKKYGFRSDSLMHLYMKDIMQWRKGQRIYPDANSTLRVAYGRIEPYSPRDGVEYRYFTTLQGIMEKENPKIYDYVVEPKLKELYETKDYGRYGDDDGSMHTCFLASNHTTGGNSGSPVLNADGYLIGINFDRNWEGTMSDLMYDPNICRNISLDIRYCLFIIDKFAGAQRLVDEMEIVE